MAIDINALKAAFSKKSQSSGGENTGFWEKFYPFYKMGFDEEVKYRFLPDLDDDNPLGFIVENRYHELNINGKKKKIACLQMYGEPCPCCALSKKHYDAGDLALGKAFWKKIDYIAQGVIVHSPFEYPVKVDENPVRLISITTKLYKVIESAIVKGEFDDMPYDLVKGFDFNIYKTKQGEYADYTTSAFSRRSTPVDDAFLQRQTFSLYDLKNYRFGKIEAEQMETMIEAFLTGKSYEETKTNDGAPAQSTGNAALDIKLAETKSVVAAETVIAVVKAEATAEQPVVSTTKKLTSAEILAKLKARAPQ